jgi:lipopolysaccharide/colanic/teichoic acid biosynthesis glycosyltransferase
MDFQVLQQPQAACAFAFEGKTKSRWDCWDSVTPRESRLSRPMDLLIAIVLIVAFIPLFVLIAAAVWIGDPGPVIFAHRRVGRNGRPFPCLKFRSMQIGAEAKLQQVLRDDPALKAEWDREQKLSKDPRVTRVGHLLRVTSLDELPQLFNVLRGDMSIVGPRPIVRQEISRYGRYIHHYLAVRPGLTGLWQVSGRSSVTYRRRVAADIKYARDRKLFFDVAILAATIPAVAAGRGSC